MCAALVHRDVTDRELVRDLYLQLGDDALFALCERNGITSIAAAALTRSLEDKPARWRHSHTGVKRRVSSYMEQLDLVAGIFAENDIPLIALKNSGIARGIYPFYGECPMGDIDVLVARTDFRKAHSLLIDLGFEFKFRSPLESEDLDKAEQGGGAEYRISSGEENSWFELQWRPVAGRWIRPDQEPDAGELLGRSVAIEGTQARMLSPEDNLLQVALHTAKHSFVRSPGFRLHTDVDRIVRETEIDWHVFLDRVATLEVKTAVYFSLALAHDLLGTPVPQEALTGLRPGQLKVALVTRWLEKVGLFEPESKKWSRIGYVLFVVLLYDDISGLVRSVFPDRAWMQQRYGEKGNLPYLYVRRILDLLLNRTLSD